MHNCSTRSCGSSPQARQAYLEQGRKSQGRPSFHHLMIILNPRTPASSCHFGHCVLTLSRLPGQLRKRTFRSTKSSADRYFSEQASAYMQPQHCARGPCMQISTSAEGVCADRVKPIPWTTDRNAAAVLIAMIRQ